MLSLGKLSTWDPVTMTWQVPLGCECDNRPPDMEVICGRGQPTRRGPPALGVWRETNIFN